MEKEEIEQRFGKLKLTETDKGKVARVEDEELATTNRNLENSLVCKVFTEKTVSLDGIKTTIPKIWNLVGQIRIEKVGKNRFVCHFNSQKEKKRVIEGSPWVYDKSLMLFEDVKGVSKIEELEFRYASMWVHFHNLPMVCFSREWARVLGNIVGEYEKADLEDDGRKHEKTLRVKVKIDILQPLVRGALLQVGSKAEESWSGITYEKLPDFCYICGRLGHVLKNCSEEEDDSTDDSQYGPWMREDNFTPNKPKGQAEGGKNNQNSPDQNKGKTSLMEQDIVGVADEEGERAARSQVGRSEVSITVPAESQEKSPNPEKKEPLLHSKEGQTSRSEKDKDRYDKREPAALSEYGAHDRKEVAVGISIDDETKERCEGKVIKKVPPKETKKMKNQALIRVHEEDRSTTTYEGTPETGGSEGKGKQKGPGYARKSEQNNEGGEILEEKGSKRSNRGKGL